jgi:hypothetical protein
MTEKLRLPELQPPHPSDKFTFEEALEAVQKVMDRQRLRESRKRARPSRERGQKPDGGEKP